MTFFERYEQLCLARGYKPVSEQAAQAIGTNRGTISAWKTNENPPKSEYLVIIADVYGVSTDYLLCRTDDPTDYTNPDLLAELAGPQLDAFDGDSRKALAFKRAVDADARREAERKATPLVMTLYDRLDDADKSKVEGFIQGLLANEKYAVPHDRKKQA